jgi:hypothetical protein
MAVYMISYDLNAPGKDYKDLYNDIQSLGPWCRYVESTYLVKTNLNIFEVEKRASQHLDGSDRMIICEIVKPIRGWLSNEQWKWINENL